jgi:hypothetical protein
MTIVYSWSFPVLDVKLMEDGLTNVVFMVNWVYAASDGDYNASVYGSVAVPAPTGDFTPYDQLTPQQVQGWVVEALGQEQIDSMTAGLASQIDLQKNPVDAALPPPWL